MCDEVNFRMSRRADARARACEHNGLRLRGKRSTTSARLRAIERRSEQEIKRERGLEEHEHLHWRRDVADMVLMVELAKTSRELQRECEDGIEDSVYDEDKSEECKSECKCYKCLWD